MPLTVPAHQAAVLPLKLVWPNRFDATALCIGSAAPDLGYAVLGPDSHRLAGVVLFAIPFALMVCRVLRRRAGVTAFAQLPDCGGFRLHSYRVIGVRRPKAPVTLYSATIGAFSHVVWDAFTHPYRWGSRLVGFDGTALTLGSSGAVSTAALLQFAGHTLGSLLAVAMFFQFGRHRLLERWYGPELVGPLRRFHLAVRSRVIFWGITILCSVLGGILTRTSQVRGVFAWMLGATVGMLVAGSVPVTAALERFDDRGAAIGDASTSATGP